MARSRKFSVEITLKEVGLKTLWIFQDHKGNLTRSVPTRITRKIGNTQHVQWRPADTMQRVSIQKNNTWIQHYYLILLMRKKNTKWKKYEDIKNKTETYDFLVYWKGYGNKHD